MDNHIKGDVYGSMKNFSFIRAFDLFFSKKFFKNIHHYSDVVSNHYGITFNKL